MGAPESLAQSPRPGHTDQLCFLPRSAAPTTAKGLSNPLFHEGQGVPAKGGAPGPTIHPCQPARPMASAATPKQPHFAVSTASPLPGPSLGHPASSLGLPQGGRSRLWGGLSENSQEPGTGRELEPGPEALGLCGVSREVLRPRRPLLLPST